MTTELVEKMAREMCRHRAQRFHTEPERIERYVLLHWPEFVHRATGYVRIAFEHIAEMAEEEMLRGSDDKYHALKSFAHSLRTSLQEGGE